MMMSTFETLKETPEGANDWICLLTGIDELLHVSDKACREFVC